MQRSPTQHRSLENHLEDEAFAADLISRLATRPEEQAIAIEKARRAKELLNRLKGRDQKQ